MTKQPWIGKPLTDITFILLPPFLSLLVIVLFPQWFQNNDQMPELGWLLLVLLIDVAHVYSTLYRTYFDPKALQQQRSLLWTIPFVGFVAGVLVYSLSALWFWRLLAYVAVFHFVRQQYGFMRVYSRYEAKHTWVARLDIICIYTATLYPVLYWHLKGPRNFNWFVADDFFFVQANGLLNVLTVIYWLIVAVFVVKEIRSWWQQHFINWPKLTIITGTLLSWYFGIVYFNGDMAFTLLNVVSHGVPYMALVWLYGEKNYIRKESGTRFLKILFSRWGVVLFVGLLVLLAFVEEGLWDLFVWREHPGIFATTQWFNWQRNDRLLSFLVPLLALPQITHYVLDGFIWKVRQDEFKWSSEVKPEA
jgi:hypothetical protein